MSEPLTGQQIMNAVRSAVVNRALNAIGADLQGRAQREAPVQEGTLRGSASYRVEQTNGKASVVVTFSTPYAARQHEEVEYKHPKGGKAKYLSDPLKQNAHRYQAIIAESIKRGLRSA